MAYLTYNELYPLLKKRKGYKTVMEKYLIKDIMLKNGVVNSTFFYYNIRYIVSSKQKHLQENQDKEGNQ